MMFIIDYVHKNKHLIATLSYRLKLFCHNKKIVDSKLVFQNKIVNFVKK